MLNRVALALILLIVTGVAAIFAAPHLGIELPWSIAARDTDPSSKVRDDEKQPAAAKSAADAIEETVAALGGASDSGAPESSEPAGSVAIDISRISPDGTSVFAGRAAPDSYVTVLENGKPAGTAKSDGDGSWSLSTEHKFASTDPKLSYDVSRTPPPEPEPKKVAAASPPPKQSPAAVAGEVMRKFENLVEEAREEAKKTEQPNGGETKREAEASPSPKPSEQSGAATETAEATVTVVPDDPPATTKAASVSSAPIPVPIMFVYNEATLTPEGQRAATLLLEYLTLKHLSAVELTGHADERGSNEYNYDLSRERLETVSGLLKSGGYQGELKLTPKGKSEPYMGIDRAAYSGEALFQLDRRVELRVTR